MIMLSRVLVFQAANGFYKNKFPHSPVYIKINKAKTIEKVGVALSNKLKNEIPCEFCYGTGFNECLRCFNGCWECENTRMAECQYCGGTGRGGGGLYNYCQKNTCMIPT